MTRVMCAAQCKAGQPPTSPAADPFQSAPQALLDSIVLMQVLARWDISNRGWTDPQ